MKNQTKDYRLVLLLILAGLLIFSNLGNIYLWQDEAGTAFIAKNILKFGLPLAYDGVNKPQTMEIYQQSSPEGWYRQPYRYAPWLSFYITAASFKLLGMNTFTARLPFAVFGLFSLVLIWRLAEAIFHNRSIAFLATLASVISIPYILHLRQCHWFSLAAFFTLWSLLAYLEMLAKTRGAAPGLTVAGILLFHSNHGVFIPVFAAIALHYFIWGRKELAITALVGPAVLIGIFTTPFLYFLSGKEFTASFNAVNVRHQIEFYFRMLNKWIFPCVALFNIWLLGSLIRRRWKWFLKDQPSGVYLLLCVVFATLAFFNSAQSAFF